MENNQFIGTSRGEKTAKIHMIIDALGNPIHFMLTGGQVHDSKAAVDMLLDIHIFGSSFLGDKAHDSQGIRKYITEKTAVFTISPKSDCTNLDTAISTPIKNGT